MRHYLIRAGWVLLAMLALVPGVGRAQNPGLSYAPPDTPLWLPLGSTRPESGGFYTFGQYVMFRQTNPLKSQPIAIRGFMTSDDSVPLVVATQTTTVQFETVRGTQLQAGQSLTGQSRAINVAGQVIILDTVVQTLQANQSINAPRGTFLGSGTEALNVDQLTGNETYQPGFELGVGWRFGDGQSLELKWMYLATLQQRNGASLAQNLPVIPGSTGATQNLADTFLFAPVFNFPIEFSGPDNKIQTNTGVQPSPQAAFGIWNGASLMTIDFTQRYQQWDIQLRTPIYETENYRLSGLVGPRFSWIWERFRWRTTSYDATGAGGPQDVGLYTNIVSNRMYGVHAGCEQEFYLGRGFAFHLEVGGALLLDTVKMRAKYEMGDRYLGLPENKRAKHEWSFVPEIEARAGFMWYPHEFIQVRADYNYMAFFNTVAGRTPIDFDYMNLSPKWSRTSRLFDGFRLGCAISF